MNMRALVREFHCLSDRPGCTAICLLTFEAIMHAMTFTKGPTISFTYEEVVDLAKQLSLEEQVKLTKELARKRLLELVKEMRPRKPVPEKEILKASKLARKRVAARYRRDAAADRR